MQIFVTDYRYFDSRYITQRSWLCQFFYYLPAVLDKLMLVMGHSIVKHNNQVYIGAWNRPKTVLAATSRNNCDLSVQNLGEILFICFVKYVFNTLYHLVSDFKICFTQQLLMVNLLYQCLSSSHRSLTLNWVEAIQPEHHMGPTYLFVLFYLLPLHSLFEAL